MASTSLLVNPPNATLPLVNPATGAPALGSGGLRFLQGITDALNGTQGVAASGVNQVTLGIGINVSAGTGTPNGVVTGNPGDLYLNFSGGAGTTLYVKESGANTNTGWVGK
jgi:hypothetical protein